jgi:hypothetical protein
MDPKNSAIPCAVFRIAVKNISGRPVDVSVLASVQNAVGYRTPTNQIRRRKEIN